jgi:hypothetical protein
MICHICGRRSNLFSEERVLKKYQVKYYQCTFCGFIQTEDPYWLSEAYSKAITVQDIGLVRRNITFSKFTNVVISILLKSYGQFLDYGGGYGLFVRLMRDLGYDFYRYDKYCENIFAVGFDVSDTMIQNFDLVTAYEVFEHLREPLSEINKMLSFSNNLLFSTAVLPSGNPKPENWWYFGLEHGQHISIFTMRSLEEIAIKHNLRFYSNGVNLHLFTPVKISRQLFKFFSRNKIFTLASFLTKRSSFVNEDLKKITGKT